MGTSTSPATHVHLPVLNTPKILSPEELVWEFRQGNDALKSKVVRLLTPLIHADFTKLAGDDLDAALLATTNFLKDLRENLSNYTDPRVRLSSWLHAEVKLFWEKPATGSGFAPDAVSYSVADCPYSVGREKCDAVNAGLKKKQQQIAPCASCNMPAVAELLAKDGTAQSLEHLDLLGMPVVIVSTATPVSEAPIHCPILDTTLVENCALPSCVYHVDYPWAHNCALSYSRTHETNLKPAEIAVLMNLPVSRVESGLQDAVSTMRGAALMRSYDTGELARDFEDIPHANVCCVCETWADSPLSKSGFTYCGNSCLVRRPPQYARIERDFGNRYRSVLQHSLNRFCSKDEAYKAIGLVYDANALDSDEPVQLKRRTGVKPAWLGNLESSVKLRIRRLDRTGT